MRTADYISMFQLEDKHWWYCGLRDLFIRTFQTQNLKLPERPRILDIGCGTGANLNMLAKYFPGCENYGFDNSQVAVELAKQKCPSAVIYFDDIRAPSLPPIQFDLVISCDALYEPGLQSSFAGLQQVVQQLAKGGLMVLHLPANQWLYSEHDQAMGTKERYTANQIDRLFSALGLRREMLTYRVSTLFPLIAAKRAPQWLRKQKVDEPRSDLAMPPRWLNEMLLGILRLENLLISRRIALPFGSSIFALGRKT